MNKLTLQDEKFKKALVMGFVTGLSVFAATLNDEIKTQDDFNRVCKAVGEYLKDNMIECEKKLKDMSVKELKQVLGELVMQEKYEECNKVKALIEFKTK